MNQKSAVDNSRHIKPVAITAGETGLRGRLAAMVAVVLLCAGCASQGDPRDPLEDVNRVVFALNDGLDKAILKPVAQGYDAVTPQPLRTGFNNFFGNINDIFIGLNNLLQGKPGAAASDFGRVMINSTVGLLGLIDIASDVGLEKHDEDFGQTLASWGVGDGPYLMLPLLGPRTLRDTAALPVDWSADPLDHVDHVRTRNSLQFWRLADRRAELLPADKVIEEAALDKYSYIRDAWLQRRRNLVYDGDPPREKIDY